VTRVPSGGAAVTLRPGLVFMDVHLPGALDGLHAAAAIWAQRPMPIIDLTGDAASALLDDVKTPPPVFTLSKPFSQAALRETIGRALAAWSDAPAGDVPLLSQNDARVSPASVGLIAPFS
jgi:CheY-like chemotaxis protein